MSKRMSIQEYREEVSKVSNGDYEVLSNEYINNRTHMQMKHKKCGYVFDMTRESFILRHSRCPLCFGNHVVVRGNNDIFTTNPDIGNMFVNKNDAYTHSIGTMKRFDFKCPDCGKIMKNKRPMDILRYGLKCTACSDGSSIPNKFVFNILNALNLNFYNEKSFEWSNGKRYDFYFEYKNKSFVVEVMGGQHYLENGFYTFGGRTLLEEIKNDNYKKELSILNGIDVYIEVDCRVSHFNYMKDSVIKSGLFDYFDVNCIDFEKCYKESLSSNIIKSIELWNNGLKVSEISRLLKLDTGTISRYLNKGNELKLCTYLGFDERLIPVMCVTTGMVFSSIKEAAQYYNIKSQTSIKKCCIGEQKYCGKDIDGSKLIWKFIAKEACENKAS